MKKELTVCDGCGKEVEDDNPPNWLNGTLAVNYSGSVRQENEKFDLCSMDCLVRFSQKKLN